MSYTVLDRESSRREIKKNQKTCSDTMKKDLSLCICEKSILHVQGESLYKLSYTNLRKENIKLPYTYNLENTNSWIGSLSVFQKFVS